MNDTPSPKHVFMSYSRRDEVIMQRVAGYLRKQGINVWVDNEKLVPGTPIWEVEIEKAIKGAGAVVVLLSPDSNTSIWVRREISFAERYSKRIFPLLIAGDEDTSIMLRLSTSQYVDIRENEEIGLNSLKVALSFHLEELEKRERSERKASEKAAIEKAEREAAEKVAKEKTEREAAEKAARDKAEREAAYKAAKEKAERQAAEKAMRENVERIAAKKTAREKAELKPLTVKKQLGADKLPFSLSLLGRILIGSILGLIISIIGNLISPLFYDPPYISVLLFFIACGLAGLITYPHKLSLLILILGFFSLMMIFRISTGDGNFIDLVGVGALYGIPVGAVISRFLHWFKVLK